MNRPLFKTEVLTLAEAAKFLRVSQAKLRRLAEQRQVPARKLGDDWRFLKPALEDWLRGKPDPRTALLQQVGAFADDETLPDLLKEIYRQRGRPEDGNLVDR
jgi:excisionase family DNA binding protein